MRSRNDGEGDSFGVESEKDLFLRGVRVGSGNDEPEASCEGFPCLIASFNVDAGSSNSFFELFCIDAVLSHLRGCDVAAGVSDLSWLILRSQRCLTEASLAQKSSW